MSKEFLQVAVAGEEKTRKAYKDLARQHKRLYTAVH